MAPFVGADRRAYRRQGIDLMVYLLFIICIIYFVCLFVCALMLEHSHNIWCVMHTDENVQHQLSHVYHMREKKKWYMQSKWQQKKIWICWLVSFGRDSTQLHKICRNRSAFLRCNQREEGSEKETKSNYTDVCFTGNYAKIMQYYMVWCAYNTIWTTEKM